MAEALTQSKRIAATDWMRGLAMTLMVLDLVYLIESLTAALIDAGKATIRMRLRAVI